MHDDHPPEVGAPRRGLVGMAVFTLAAVCWVAWAVIRVKRGDPGESSSVPPLELVADAGSVEERADVRDHDKQPSTERSTPASSSSSDPSSAPDGSSAAPPQARRPGWWRNPAFADRLTAPELVRYTIRRGGSLERVANLFKIYHHEMRALNPGVDFERELASGTRVVVYRGDERAVSESLGTPSAGSLDGAIPMMEGPGRVIRATPWKTWGTSSTVRVIDLALSEWIRRMPSGPPIIVGNLSARKGGRLEPHSTHQSGRDVDLSYPHEPAESEELTWQEMSERNFDAAKTWVLLDVLVETGGIDRIFIDRSLQKLLYEHAMAHQTVPKAELSSWLEYPGRSGGAETIVTHVSGHTDHIHVRVACPPSHTRCKSNDLPDRSGP